MKEESVLLALNGAPTYGIIILVICAVAILATVLYGVIQLIRLPFKKRRKAKLRIFQSELNDWSNKISELLRCVTTAQDVDVFFQCWDQFIFLSKKGNNFLANKMISGIPEAKDALKEVQGLTASVIEDENVFVQKCIMTDYKHCYFTIKNGYTCAGEFLERNMRYKNKYDKATIEIIQEYVKELEKYEKIVGTIEETDEMDGHEFEHWCAELLKKLSYTNVEVTPGSGDQGVDILAEKDGIKYAVQCKCYSSDLGNTPVQEVHAGKNMYHCHVGVVLTNRHFTKGAKALSDATGVLLWDREWIESALKIVATQK